MDESKSRKWWSEGRFWDEFKPLMFDDERLDSAVEEVDGILKLSGAHAPSEILDVGCGPGRHSIEFARRGYRITGIDIHEPYLKEAEERSADLEPKPRFMNLDMRTYTFDQPFDGAVSLFQSLGYFDDPDDDLQACRQVFTNLKDGGWFIVDMDGKEVVASSFEKRSWFERDGRLILLEYSVEAAWTSLRNHWIFRDEHGNWHESEFTYRLYSALELGRLLERAGFDSVEFFGSLDGRPYDENAERLVALARRA